MRILFTSGTMKGGGAERVVSTLSNSFVERGLSVSILVVRGPSEYKLDQRIQLNSIYEEDEIKTSVFNKIWRRLNFYPRLFGSIRAARPDVLITVHGGGWNGLMILMAKLLRVKVIAAEHISHTVNSKRFLTWLERNIVYHFSDALTVLTHADFSYYSGRLPRVYLLPNPLGFPVINYEPTRKKIILAAGQLNRWHHKGFDNLLKIFSAIAPVHNEWRLQIAGSGEEGLMHLTQLSKDLNIEDRVSFLGFREDIDHLMREASIFVLSSRFEGFGMVLLEAMSQGCTCVSFDCKSGPSDIIESNIDGILVADQNNPAMTNALLRLLTDSSLRTRLASEGKRKADKFSASSIADKWINLFRLIGVSD